MTIRLLASCYFSLFSWVCFASPLQNDNIPIFRREAPEVIRFCTTRSLGEEALKKSLLEKLKNLFKIQAFIETGTYLGSTAWQAASIFNEVHTIELSRELYLQATKRFKAQKNVFVYQGNSGELLASILQTIPVRVLIYLDGHYSSGITAKGELNTPIEQELAEIKRAGKSDSLILVDDIRLFQDSFRPEKVRQGGIDGYPELRELVSALLEINPLYQICFLGDALLAFPPDPSICVSPVMNACALHRLSPLLPELSPQVLESADHTIARSEADEQEEINVYYTMYAPFELEYGYRSFSSLWLGLILQEQGRDREAMALFEQASQNSMPHWRIETLKY